MIISLTSIPPRFCDLGPVLGALAGQGLDEVWLWIPETYDRFPDWDGSLPTVPEGVTIRRCPVDLGPATKILPTLAHVDDETRVLICDDDAIYSPGWAAGFRVEALAHPEAAIAASTFCVSRIGLVDAAPTALIAQGFAGISLTRSMLTDHRIGGRDRWVDDIWLSAMLAAGGTPIRPAPHLRAKVTPQSATAGLQDQILDGQSRAEANRRSALALAQELGIWGPA